MAEQASVTRDVQQGVLILTVQDSQIRGDAMAEALRQEFLNALDETGCRKAVVDLHNVELITTPAFRPLLSLRRKLHSLGDGRLMLCGLQPMVAEVFHVTRLISSSGSSTAPFEVQPDVARAIEAVSKD